MTTEALEYAVNIQLLTWSVGDLRLQPATVHQNVYFAFTKTNFVSLRECFYKIIWMILYRTK